ncbi:HAD-IIB family hydrolase [Pseudoxanthomonas mexicana]|uniref:HAD-IIB family hydrolase n=1 Tax=Pseudoxanthomonas mexicana TaxID=128785 RepID=A0ABX6R8P0_PSEMX|nr:HAD-IIB family hydrolase [Pseudoxanthomonas mexicana]QND79577.1 HAD-IIB family hydrolase [Pseudoxanthomonas mexicana]
MATNRYQSELEQLPETYAGAMREDVAQLKGAIAGASESSVIGVGSGGSFTVASLLCNLHEAYTGRVSRPSTPLEIICNPTLASSSPVFLISAEGKNPDITEALDRARHHSARPIHVLTNRNDSPLMVRSSSLSDVNTHVFELREKDGYLATNSLLLDAVLVARAYSELDGADDALPSTMRDLRLSSASITEWLASAEEFVQAAAHRGAVIVTYSPLLRPIAADLESKLAEGALLHCQLADLRSFAHGRHLWLAERPHDTVVLALIEPSLAALWEKMQDLLPSNVPTFTMPLPGALPRDLITGLVSQMHLINAIARRMDKDPGQPSVPKFGREIYYLDLPEFIPVPAARVPADEQSKYDVLGARWPSPTKRSDMSRARNAFVNDIVNQPFRAVVFDYDGTLTTSQRRTEPPAAPVIGHLQRLVEAGVIVGIASGRGRSIQKELNNVLPQDVLSRLFLGLYNAGWIGPAVISPEVPSTTVEFLSHVTRIVRRLKSLGVPIERIKTTHPYQVSIRFRDGLPTDQMWFVVADALRQAGLTTNSMFRSKHSIDVLAPRVGKSGLVAHIIQKFKVDPHQIVTIGDQGAWPGNDVSLLEHRFSLSVDMPSRRLDRGWKLAPGHKRDVDATLWYMDRFQIIKPGVFSITL